MHWKTQYKYVTFIITAAWTECSLTCGTTIPAAMYTLRWDSVSSFQNLKSRKLILIDLSHFKSLVPSQPGTCAYDQTTHTMMVLMRNCTDYDHQMPTVVLDLVLHKIQPHKFHYLFMVHTLCKAYM